MSVNATPGIAKGLDVVYVSKILGHANPDITLRVYAHLFAQAEHGEKHRALLEETFGNDVVTSGSQPKRTATPPPHD